MGIVSDYGPNFGSDVMSVGYLPAGVYDDKNENGADYEGVVNFAGGPNYNNNVPDDAMISIDSIEIRIQNPGTVSLDALYMSKLASDQLSSSSSTDSTDGTTASTDASQEPPSDPSQAEPSATEAADTTAHTSPGTGYGMGALALAAMLLAVSASGVYFCRKTKA